MILLARSEHLPTHSINVFLFVSVTIFRHDECLEVDAKNMIKKREYEMLLTEEGHLDLNGLVTFDYVATF